MDIIQEQPQTADSNDSEKKESVLDTTQFDIVKAVQHGILDRVRQLVDNGNADVKQPDSENVTLLHWAAINNRPEVVNFLLQRGADINAIGGDLHSTPIQWATRQGVLAMVVQLLQHGADPLIPDSEGQSCIHLAAQIGHTAIAAYLIAKGTNVDHQDRNGMTPLAW